MPTVSFADLRQSVKYEIAGGYVNILGMMSKDLVELQKQFEPSKDIDPHMMGTVVAKCVVDDLGVPLMTFDHAMQLSPGVLAELFVQVSKASGFHSKDEPPKNSQTQSVTCTDSAKSQATNTPIS